MTDKKSHGFGGDWTERKLEILEKYLNFYTTALTGKFRLLYVDAFAGTGEISYGRSGSEGVDAIKFIEGSATRALNLSGKPFDRIVFVEKEGSHYDKLMKLKESHPGRSIEVRQKDANAYLRNELSRVDWEVWRGVLFLDPFATEVEWATIKAIANYRALDMWVLFPVGAIMRMMPKSANPDELACADKLNRIFGDDGWKALYRQNPQQNLWGDAQSIRDRGTQGVWNLYQDKLRSLFGERFTGLSKRLMNSKNSTLFEFIFCVGSPSQGAIQLASKVAKHLVEGL